MMDQLEFEGITNGRWEVSIVEVGHAYYDMAVRERTRENGGWVWIMHSFAALTWPELVDALSGVTGWRYSRPGSAAAPPEPSSLGVDVHPDDSAGGSPITV
jgi:hypothetical protein